MQARHKHDCQFCKQRNSNRNFALLFLFVSLKTVMSFGISTLRRIPHPLSRIRIHSQWKLVSGPHHLQHVTTARSFSVGANGGTANSFLSSDQKGEIMIYDEQTYLNLDLKKLEETCARIRSEIGYEKYSVTLVLTNDEEMQETNLETRNVDAPTDILSFPMHPSITQGKIEPPQFEIPDLYTLGDILVDTPYVMRRCEEDAQETENDIEERGVSGAMANVSDPHTRIHMLLVHGMLHLIGYDHIEDGDYDLMVQREEEILEKLELHNVFMDDTNS